MKIHTIDLATALAYNKSPGRFGTTLLYDVGDDEGVYEDNNAGSNANNTN
jgi:hypothetical protein